MSFEQKIDVIKRRTRELETKVNSLADAFLQRLIEDFVDRLDVKDGIVQNTPGNLALLNRIDALFAQFNAQVAAPEIAGHIRKGFEEIHGFNTDYFSDLAESKAKYAATEKQVEKLMLDRLGFGDKTKLKPGGFMDIMFRDPTIANEIKNFTRAELVKNIGFKQFKDGLRRMIKTDAQSMGAFERYYRNYAYDIFVNVDREESLLTAKALNLTYFIYSGTLIDTSREFCRKRAGKVFTTEETDLWKNDPWIQNAIKKGYIASYDPIRDMGLWGCRHVPQFVSKQVAERMRPDLKAKQPQPQQEQAPDPNKFVPADKSPKIKENIKRHIADRSGFRIGTVTASSDLKPELFNRMAGKLADLFDEYEPNPALIKNQDIKLSFRSSRRFYGFVKSYGNKAGIQEMNFGHKTDGGQSRKFVDGETKLRFKSAVDDDNVDVATVVHEFAHVLYVKHHKQFSNDRMKDFHDRLEKVYKAYFRQLREAKTDADRYKIHLGDYAGTNMNEFMAEGFTEYKLKTKPSKYAVIVGRMIDRYFKK